MSKQEKIVCAAIKYNAWDGELGRYSESPSYICGVNWSTIEESHAYKVCCVWGSATKEAAGFMTNKERFVDPVEAMKIAVKAEQVGGIFWKKIEIRTLNELGLTDRAKAKQRSLDETIKNYLEFPLKPEDLD